LMARAKTIDRLELTKRSSAFLRNRNKNKEQQSPTVSDIPPDIDIHALGDVCPMCGQHTLIHESGCVKCPSCSWSACG
ncbi:MAG: hypothetical protein IJ587_04855, partial [Synergistaceae bacterium]|nr:hypothetical protein [Synergistaceae bacterium]